MGNVDASCANSSGALVQAAACPVCCSDNVLAWKSAKELLWELVGPHPGTAPDI